MVKRTHHATYTINDPLVRFPKFRRSVLAGAVGVRLAARLPHIVTDLEGDVVALVVRPDPVHLLASFPPTLAIAQLMHNLNGVSSHERRAEFPPLNSQWPSRWTRSYYIGTAGQVSAETIKGYLAEQRRS